MTKQFAGWDWTAIIDTGTSQRFLQGTDDHRLSVCT